MPGARSDAIVRRVIADACDPQPPAVAGSSAPPIPFRTHRWIVMLGATGAVGGETVCAQLLSTATRRLTLLGRRPLDGIDDPRVARHTIDVLDTAGFARLLPGHDTAIRTLGVGQPSGTSRETFARIDRQAVSDFAAACSEAGVARFSLLGSVGASSRSRSFYPRTKGEPEADLRALAFERLKGHAAGDRLHGRSPDVGWSHRIRTAIREDRYVSGGYDRLPEFARDRHGVRRFDGVGFSHPRGPRIGYWNRDYRGLRSAVRIDGTLNDDRDRDRGWTVELALPWTGLAHLAGSRPLYRRGRAMSGEWTSRASTPAAPPPPPATRAAGPGAPTASGIPMCRSASCR